MCICGVIEIMFLWLSVNIVCVDIILLLNELNIVYLIGVMGFLISVDILCMQSVVIGFMIIVDNVTFMVVNSMIFVSKLR